MSGTLSCAEARRLLLEIDLDALDTGDGPLPDHLRGCHACRAAADGLTRAARTLDAWLAPTDAAPTVDALLARRAARSQGARPAHPRFGRRRIAWLSLAAAAVVAAWFVRVPTAPSDRPAVATGAEPLPLVQDAGDRSVAVLPTDDPDITLVWFF